MCKPVVVGSGQKGVMQMQKELLEADSPSPYGTVYAKMVPRICMERCTRF